MRGEERRGMRGEGRREERRGKKWKEKMKSGEGNREESKGEQSRVKNR